MNNLGELETRPDRRAEAGILASKLAPAITRRRGVPARVRLLLRPSPGCLVLVHAAAGYGKTTALAATQEEGSLWYNLDRSDSSPLVLANRLCAVLGLEPLDSEVSVVGEVVALELASRLQGRSLAITFDRFEQLGAGPEVGHLLSELLVLVPALSLRVATRVRPLLPLERLRLSGRLLDAGPAELCLRRTEIAEVLRDAWQRTPRPDEIEFADSVLRGWPAALQLWQAGVRDNTDLEAPLQGGQPLHDYLHEELIRTVEPGLLQVVQSDFSWLCGEGPLLTRATTKQRRAVADRLIRDRVGVVPGPDGWELHPLANRFAEMHVARPRPLTKPTQTSAELERRRLPELPRDDATEVVVRTLGGLVIMVGAVSLDKSVLPTSVRRLLELLLCLPGYQTTAHQAARLLWPHHLERSALNSFNVALHGLRRVLEPGLTARSESRYVLRNGRTYRLCVERIACDVESFCQLVCQVQQPLAESATQQLEAAVDLYRGDFLATSAEDFAQERRVQLRRIVLDVLDRLGEWHSVAGDVSAALRVYERLLELEPHREDVWGRLLEVHIAGGDDYQALAALRRCEETLRAAHIEPSRLLKELHQRIRDERPNWANGRPLTA
jgi:DNA-binding SARP family transcriptional activator